MAVKRLYIDNDNNFSVTKSGDNPRITLDSGDYLEYDRTNNRHGLWVGSDERVRVGTTTTIFGPTIGDNRVVINGSGASLVVSGTTYAGRLIIHDEAADVEIFGLHKHHATERGHMFMSR